jgi:hypothetical protein
MADAMSDGREPFYTPNRTPDPPRQPKPGEVLWALVRDGHWRRAELRDHGKVGAELQIHVNGEFVNGRRFERRDLALAEAAAARHAFEALGWTDKGDA